MCFVQPTEHSVLLRENIYLYICNEYMRDLLLLNFSIIKHFRIVQVK